MSTENAPLPRPNAARELRAALGRSRIFAVSFFFDLLVLFVLVLLLDGRVRLRIPVQGRSAIQVLRIILFLAAAASVLAARLVNGRLLRTARKADGTTARLAGLGRAAIVSLAVSIVPAATGFVLFIVAGQIRDFYLLAFVSLLLLFFYFPRPAPWEDVLADRPRTCPL
jgi:hypothetical protein